MGAFSSMNPRRRENSLPEQQKGAPSEFHGVDPTKVDTPAANEFREFVGQGTESSTPSKPPQ